MTGNIKIRSIYFLIFSFFIAFCINAEEIINYSSGIYNDDILVSINIDNKYKDIYYSFGDEESTPAFPYRGGLLLSAVPGEKRNYSLNFLIDDELYGFNYIIDKELPSEPTAIFIDNEDGYGYIFKKDNDAKVIYGHDDYNQKDALEWSGETVPVPKSGYIYYYSVDEAGNRSKTKYIKPDDDPVLFSHTFLNVKSPVEGVFSNPQLLFIEKNGFEWIKYTLNGTDPLTQGLYYSTPIEIRRYGNVIVRIAAKPFNSDKIIRKEIHYHVKTKAPLKNIPASGIYSGAVNIKKPLNNHRYCLDDRPVNSDDDLLDTDLKISPVYGGVKYFTIRLGNKDLDSDFRYFYVIDDRVPSQPVIEVTKRLPQENLVDIRMYGPDYADIYYTVDGSTPVKSSTKYKGKFSLKLPEDKNAGSIIIKARAISLNEKSGNVVSEFITYDTKKPDKPEVLIEQNIKTGLYNLSYKIDEDDRLFYRIADSNDELSPIDKNNFFLDIPDGTKNNFSFVFSVRDSAGNWSEPTEPVNVSLDKSILAEPEISLNDGILTIDYSGEIEYSYVISLNGNIVFEDYGSYNESLDLNKYLAYGSILKLKIKIIDSNGNTHFRNFVYNSPVEAKEKQAALFSGNIENVYSGSEVEFNAYSDGLDDKLFYYLTEIRPDGEKILQGPIATNGKIIIYGAENKKKDFLLEVYSVEPKTNKKSKVKSYSFTIDNEKPAVPVISGIKNGTVTNQRVIISPQADDDSTLFLNYSESRSDLGIMFGQSSIIFDNPLVFDVDKGESKTFYLQVGAVDSAGNKTINNEIFSFVIDKKPPQINDVMIDKDSIRVLSPEKITNYYEIGLKGTFIKDPDENSPSFKKMYNFEDLKEKPGTYIIKIISVDEAGNELFYPLTYSVKIDNKIPKAPDRPDIILNEKLKKVFICWPDNYENIFFRINNGKIQEYKHPFSYRYNGESSEFTISYYASDSINSTSKVNSISVKLPGKQDYLLAEGIMNNGFYKENLILESIKTNGIIRYEISTDQIVPPRVSVFSPLLPEKLPFKIAEGESINFIVSLKEFKSLEDEIGGAEQVIRFTIDKQPPEPPVIQGVDDGEYYLTDIVASFKLTQDYVYYSVQNNINEKGEFKKYIEPFEINSPNGMFNSYLIKAYTEDFSGNKSKIKEWNITIDKEIIYVSEQGMDYYEGTRSWPYASLNKALQQVDKSERKTIFVEEGNYVINSPVLIDENITIYGGFKRGNWNEKAGTSIITVSKEFLEKSPAFYVKNGTLTIDTMEINTGEVEHNNIFVMDKGRLNLINVSIESENLDTASFIKQNHGELTISNCTINSNIGARPFISTNSGSVKITKSNILAKSNKIDTVFLHGKNCFDYDLNSINLYLTDSKSITAMSFENCKFKMKASEIDFKDVSISANAIESKDSTLNISYSKISGGKDNRITRAIISEDCIIDFNRNNLNIESRAGIIGFNLKGGESNFHNNRIKLGTANDFSYLWILHGGDHKIETNIINVKAADEVISIRAKDSVLDFLSNTVNFEGGNNRTIFIKSERNSKNRIINNILNIRNETGNSIVIYDDTENDLTKFKNNCLYGWNTYITGNHKADSLIAMDLIDGLYTEGDFSNNLNENPDITFKKGSDYELSSESKCIDSGFDLKDISDTNKDFDGEIRPNKDLKGLKYYDIGADEFYPEGLIN